MTKALVGLILACKGTNVHTDKIQPEDYSQMLILVDISSRLVLMANSLSSSLGGQLPESLS